MFHTPSPPDNLEQRRQLQKQRLQHRIQLQSRQIESVMDAHQLPVQVSGGTVEPHQIAFDLQTQLHGSWQWVRGLTTELRQALGVPQISLFRENGRLQLSVARPMDAPVRLLDLMAMGMEVERETAVLGLSDEGQPVMLPLHKNHVLITGVNAAGKTSLLRTIAVSLALRNRQSRLQQVIIAPAFADNNAFSQLEPLTIIPHMSAQIAYTLDDAVQHLAWLVAELEYRLRWHETSPSIILMIDQFVQIMDVGGSDAVDAITMLLQRGGEANIHLILTTSEPDADLLDAHIKANLPLRLVGQAANADQARVASGLADSEAEYLLGRGDFLLVDEHERVYFQAAFVGDYDLHLCLKKLHQKSSISLLAHPFWVRPELKIPEPSPIPQSFWVRNGATHIDEQEE